MHLIDVQMQSLLMAKTTLQCSKNVCLSVKCINCDKTKDTYAHILIPCERLIILVFRHGERLVRDVPFYLKF